MKLVSGTFCILWLDPGGTTGWASYDAEVMVPPELERRQHGTGMQWEFYKEKFNSGELGPGKHHLALWDLLAFKRPRNYILGYESFENRGNDAAVLVAKEYIGVCELYAAGVIRDNERAAYNGHPFTLDKQTAAEGKGFWYPKMPGSNRRDKSKLVKVKKYSPNHTHANDAMAHLLHYMAFTMDRTDLLEPLKWD